MGFIEFLKAVILGVVEGLTEWLPISSTGHMILVDQFLQLNMSSEFIKMFLVVIQLGAIMAVVLLYWRKLLPFSYKEKKIMIRKKTFVLWGKILVACLPAAVIGLIFDNTITAIFYNYQTVAIMLIIYGVLFIVIENWKKNKMPEIRSLSEITYKTALFIGVFQVLSLIPGTSRSGATIIGAIIVGTSRTIAAEFTFFLAIPIMFGASILKLVKFGMVFTGWEVFILLTGMITAFVTSVFAIKFLMTYIKKHDFKIFGWYRIVLGIIVLGYFLIIG
ncbi:undecaprenyl-diphosphate phosphatase [Acetobacterium sp.]|uniref:undecaprenyl-diphosphate phosphatase n=1 Tax=Acetobacterium sp. TaxID=1872094 RepID=UPI002F427FDB